MRVQVANDADGPRANLQVRLALLFKLMVWSFIALLAFLWVLYRVYPEIRPAHHDRVWVISAAGVAIMSILWRGVLARDRPVRREILNAIDLFYAMGTGTVIAASAMITYDFRPSSYTCLIYVCDAVLTRALVVPSSGRRTALASTLAFVPMLVPAIALIYLEPQEIPGPAYFLGFLVVAVVAVLVSSAGSLIIYDLRRAADAAQQLGIYRVRGLIGEGGLGEVYLAEHLLLRRPTAIKLLRPDRISPENLERFEREVQETSQLSHPNTVAVFDFGHSNGRFYYAMEYIDGVNLNELVKQHGPQRPARVVHILVQVASALQEAHDRNLIHRDIKPANIMLCMRGGVPDVAKVVDFGLAKRPAEATGVSTQVLLGTPQYMAPESVSGAASASSDLYALGAVGYFLLTGRPVFAGNEMEVVVKHMTTMPEPPSKHATVPPALEAVIMRCLAKAPEQRHASATELADALRAAPIDDTWSEGGARAWWLATHAMPRTFDPKEPTRTITIDSPRSPSGALRGPAEPDLSI
ncbi:MAG TPA: serine/threonine-protein kinase, partial [Kofleriaceae bacterium]